MDELRGVMGLESTALLSGLSRATRLVLCNTYTHPPDCETGGQEFYKLSEFNPFIKIY